MDDVKEPVINNPEVPLVPSIEVRPVIKESNEIIGVPSPSTAVEDEESRKGFAAELVALKNDNSESVDERGYIKVAKPEGALDNGLKSVADNLISKIS